MEPCFQQCFHLVCHWKRHPSPWVWIFCLIRSWIKTQWNTIYMTYIQQFCWLLDTRAIIKFEKFIWKVETSKLNVLQLSTHTCTCLFFLLDCYIWCLCSIKPSLHLENGVVVCYIDFSVNFWSRRAEGGISIKRCLLLWNPQIWKTPLKAHFHQCMTVFWHLR